MMSHLYHCPDPPHTSPDDTQIPLAKSCSVSLRMPLNWMHLFTALLMCSYLCMWVHALLYRSQRFLNDFLQRVKYIMYSNENVCFHNPSLMQPLHPDICMSICVCACVIYLNTSMCVYVFVCLYECLGSQRLSEPEFDEGTAVVSKGGWGLFLCSCIVSQAGFIFVVLFRQLFGRKSCMY